MYNPGHPSFRTWRAAFVVGALCCGSLVAPAVAGPAPEASNIIGGAPAAVGEFPTVVLLEAGGGICTGTLIAKDWVLTAAHCIHPQVLRLASQEQVTQSLRVVIDTTGRSGGRRLTAKATIPNPRFSISDLGHDDIGLVQLATPVTDRPFQTINLAANKTPAGTVATQVGYGMSQAGNQASAGTLRKISDRTTVACGPYGVSDAMLLCFNQTDGKGKCQGDSGGPSFAMIDGKMTQIGVTSFGDQTCQTFGADTRTEAHKDFLKSVLGDIVACAGDGACNMSCGAASPDPDCPACKNAADCGDGKICRNNFCEPEPYAPGGTGSTCTKAEECVAGTCGQVGDEKRCVGSCNLANNDCPSGFDCLSLGNNTGGCWPAADDGGCCSVGASPADVAPIAALVLGVVVFGGRRRKRQ